MADTSLQTKEWSYQIVDRFLYLFKIDKTTTDYYVAPDLDVTDGIKVEYVSGDKVFVDSSGFSEDSSPTEDSYINAQDSMVYAVIEFVKGKLYEDMAVKENDVNKKAMLMRISEVHMKNFKVKYHKAKSAMQGGVRVAVTHSPWAIR